jgi:hypothetical protein
LAANTTHSTAQHVTASPTAAAILERCAAALPEQAKYARINYRAFQKSKYYRLMQALVPL